MRCDVGTASAFTAVELRHAFIPAQTREIHRRRRLGAVIVGVIADLVFLQGGDHVGSLALFQRARLLADDLEGGANALAGEEVGHLESGVVAGGQEVVFRVEPEDDVDLRLPLRLGGGGGANSSKPARMHRTRNSMKPLPGVESIELQNDAGGGGRDEVGAEVDGAAEEKPSLRRIFDHGGEIDAQAGFQFRRRRQLQGATIGLVRREGKDCVRAGSCRAGGAGAAGPGRVRGLARPDGSLPPAAAALLPGRARAGTPRGECGSPARNSSQVRAGRTSGQPGARRSHSCRQPAPRQAP